MKVRCIHTQLPATLFSLCLETVACNLSILGTYKDGKYTLHKDLVLPSHICEQFLLVYQDNGNDINDSLAHLFKDVTKTPLRSVYIHHSSITDVGLSYFLRHNLYELKLANCKKLNQNSFASIFEYSKNLESLVLGPRVHMTNLLSYYQPLMSRLSRIVSFGDNRPMNLKLLSLKRFNNSSSTDNISWCFKFNDFPELKILDFSYSLCVTCLQFASPLVNLHTLVLFQVPIRNMERQNTILHVCKLKTLVVLDISRSLSPPELSREDMFQDEYNTLALIVRSLPKLKSLDISGTNLASRGPAEGSGQGEASNGRQCGIPGLESRIDNPLEYLGLFHTMYDACKRKHIPAKIITGNANEEQLFNALTSYMHHKPALLARVLLELTHFLEHHRCEQIDKAVLMVINAISTNVDNNEVHASGITALFQIMVHFPLHSLGAPVIRKLYSALETGLSLFIYDNDVSYKIEDVVSALKEGLPE